MSLSRRLTLILLVLLSCIGFDQATKVVAQRTLPHDQPWSYLGDTLRLQVAHNYGAFLSLGDSLPPQWRQGLLSMGVAAVLLGILVYLLRSSTVDRRVGIA